MFSGAGQGRQNAAKSARTMRPPSTMSNYPEDDSCSHCGSDSGKLKSKKMSCWAFIFLLAVDAFTIGLLLVLYSHHVNHHQGIRNTIIYKVHVYR